LLAADASPEGELVFLKLGGSLVTDKTRALTVRTDVLLRLSSELAAALADRPGLRLVLGHGSGSFGHVLAQRHGTRRGVHSPEDWRGYAATARAAAQLNRQVVDALWDAGVHILPLQPSASASCRAGELTTMDERPLIAALEHDLVPLVYGDVALDVEQGGTIVSTEQIFSWLAPRLLPQRIVLAGEVPGVFTADPAAGTGGELLPAITPATLGQLVPALGGSRGVDVTGGMLTKVSEMVNLLRKMPASTVVQIISGLVPDLLRAVLVDPAYEAGTRIQAS
jgi:isopentenyl phosphate kinase